MKEQIIKVTNNTNKISSKAIQSLDQAVVKTINGVDYYVNPLRKSALRRFPILFSLFVTLGVSLIFLGLEKLLMQITFLNNNPLLMLSLGIVVLALTGTLYKKLS